MKKVLTSLLALSASLAFAAPALAGPTGYSSKTVSSKGPSEPLPPVDTCQCFGPGEGLFDIYAAYGFLDEEEGVGGGIRYTQFVDRHFGFMFNYGVLGEQPIHDLSLSFVARAPIESLCIAPYAYVGPGFYANGSNDFTYHAGAGLDVRLFGCEGLFVDYKHTFSDSNDFGVVAVGYRFNF